MPNDKNCRQVWHCYPYLMEHSGRGFSDFYTRVPPVFLFPLSFYSFIAGAGNSVRCRLYSFHGPSPVEVKWSQDILRYRLGNSTSTSTKSKAPLFKRRRKKSFPELLLVSFEKRIGGKKYTASLICMQLVGVSPRCIPRRCGQSF